MVAAIPPTLGHSRGVRPWRILADSTDRVRHVVRPPECAGSSHVAIATVRQLRMICKKVSGPYSGVVMGVPLGADAPRHDVSTVDDVLALVRESGGRVTNSRRLLLEAIFNDPGHHSAEDLAAIVQARAPDVHLSTIYRNLEELERLGVDRPFPSRARTRHVPPGRECALPLRVRDTAATRSRHRTSCSWAWPSAPRSSSASPSTRTTSRSSVAAATAGSPERASDQLARGADRDRPDSLRFGSMPGPARSVVVAMDATPLLGVRTGVGESVAGFIDCGGHRSRPRRHRVRPQRSRQGEPFRSGCPAAVRPGRRIPIPAGALLRTWARVRPPRGRTVDRPGRRGARHQLRRATLTQGGPARDRARPDPAALPRALQPDVAALSRPDPSRHRRGRLRPHGVAGHGGRRHGPLPRRGRSGARHPQRADAAAALRSRATSRNPRTSSPSGPWSRARASPISWRPSIASPSPSPTSI